MFVTSQNILEFLLLFNSWKLLNDSRAETQAMPVPLIVHIPILLGPLRQECWAFKDASDGLSATQSVGWSVQAKKEQE